MVPRAKDAFGIRCRTIGDEAAKEDTEVALGDAVHTGSCALNLGVAVAVSITVFRDVGGSV
jgi:hypothetical protein